MNFYPVNLNLKAKKVLIVGGGRVGLRKFKRLLKAEAEITVISLKFDSGFKAYLDNNSEQFKLIKRKFKEDDLKGMFLVFAATDNQKLNERIALLARGKKILINLIDNSQLSDFTVPAAVNKGELLLTASTGSNLPALSKNIKEKLGRNFGVEYQILLKLMKKRRVQIIAEIDEIDKRKEIFKELASDQFLERIKKIIKKFNLNSTDFRRRDKFISRQSKVKELELELFFTKVEAEIDKIIAELRDD